jgi:hypothetical protein
MSKRSRSKVTGELSAAGEKQQSATQSSKEESASKQESPNTSATSASSQSPQSPTGFRVTQSSVEIDDVSANVQVLTALATKLGALVEWKRLELGDGREVIALCFPLEKWVVDPAGTLAKKG